MKRALILSLLAVLALAGETPPRELTTASGVVMVRIPAGSFRMGDAKGAAEAQPVHEVALSAFLMDKFEVSQESFQALMPVNPSRNLGPKNPVEQVRWFQAAQYCNARSAKEGLKPCYDPKTWACEVAASGYRLPSEAEWEYACRAGTATTWGFGDDARQLAQHAWVKENAGGTSHAVGGKPANAWGLHDLHGNVLEWCQDFYAPAYYAASPAQDPPGPASGQQRVLRGGGWRAKPASCTAGWRGKDDPANADICAGYPDYGFRCVRRE